MELSVYTSALETAIQQMLSQVYHVAEYGDSIECQVFLSPNIKRMFYEVKLHRLLPRYQPASKVWALELYKRLRLFPGQGTTIKFDEPKTHWTPTHYGHSYVSTDKTWSNLTTYRGFDVEMTGSINAPEKASDFITVKLNWDFKPEGGTPITRT